MAQMILVTLIAEVTLTKACCQSLKVPVKTDRIKVSGTDNWSA